jgi:N-acetyl-gamma-glutamyl-phosphate reductase
MLKIGIVGISGYSGVTALELLLKHPQVRVTYVSANNTQGKVSEIWPHLLGVSDLVCNKFDPQQCIQHSDLIFLAVPHKISMELAPQLLKAGKKVIDLSGDYRLKNADDYEKWYGTRHIDTANMAKAVYGLPELFREDIKKAQLISNPGCYPTAAILALAPIVSTKTEDLTSIMIDAKSGVTGAGRKATLSFSFSEVNENFKAYKVLQHQHEPEIQLYLNKIEKQTPSIHFVAHLLPLNRGIQETIYLPLKKNGNIEEIHKVYKNFYKNEPFVRVLALGQQPEIKNVAHTNYCDIGVALSEDKKLLVVTSAIDNLLKGASGQAVQNMNIMCGFQETESLI